MPNALDPQSPGWPPERAIGDAGGISPDMLSRIAQEAWAAAVPSEYLRSGASDADAAAASTLARRMHQRTPLVRPDAGDVASRFVGNVLSLPERAFGASENLRTGGPYDPGPALEASMMTMGATPMGMGARGAGEAVVGAGPVRPRIVSSKPMQEAVLRNEWARNGADLDFDEVWQTAAGDRAWRKLVDAHNQKHGTSFDPDNMPHNSTTKPIFDAFEQAYLKGRKAKFPGVQAANEYFENDGRLDRAAYLKGEEPGTILGSGPTDKTAGAAMMAGAESRPGIRAYHGSPYDFDRFDMSKIGTGEGAQAYGHGLYFAEAEGTARSYRDTLAGPHNRLMDKEGVIIEPSPFDDGTWRLAKLNPEGQMRGYHGYRGIGLTDYDFPSVEAAAAHAKNKGLIKTDALLHELGSEGEKIPFRSQSEMSSPFNQVVASNPGRMYEVSINADPSHFLDWDRPLSGQPENIRQALQGLGQSEGNKHLARTGESAVQSLATNLGGREKAAEALRSAGIPGIKYLDQGSRDTLTAKHFDVGQPYSYEGNKGWYATTRGGGPNYAQHGPFASEQEAKDYIAKEPWQTRNFVLFRDDIIDIIRKYALAGMLGGGAAAPYMMPRSGNALHQ